jgi:BirA family transcriptional regulator, biotin operon repressor / biotin---[acetyl-CoA-carboxylase] ligase|tara:strand:+ start:986 stop:1954 length:969 start_codon:yes stop_codon:yes gene_type:complete
MDRLLIILSDGKYHSGEDLGKELGISRSAVWKQVKKISALGVLLESKKGCGYRISGGLELLDSGLIQQQLSVAVKPLLSNMQILSTVSSTNMLARQHAEQGNASGWVVLAEEQTNGRGRRGKSWVSPYGCNLYLSLVWGFDGGVKEIEGLSLAVAVVVLRGLRLSGVEGLSLKWPNDLLYQNKKIGGILLEVVGDPSGYCQVVIGVGININMSEQPSRSIGQAWGNVGELSDSKIGRNQLAGVMIDQLLLLLSKYKKIGFVGYKEEWLQHDTFMDKRVKLLMMNNSVEGIVRGIDDSGALILEVDGAVKIFSGGEISLRGFE